MIGGGGTDLTLPSIGTDTLEDYPDEDGTNRVGKPFVTTTTRKVYYAPPPIGVVGGVAGTWLNGGLFGCLLVATLLRM